MKYSILISLLISTSAFAAGGRGMGREVRTLDPVAEKAVSAVSSRLLEKQRGLQVQAGEARALAIAAESFKSFNSFVNTLLEKPAGQNRILVSQLAHEGARIAGRIKDADVGNVAAVKNLFPVMNSMSLAARGEIKGADAQVVARLAKEVADNLERGMAPNDAVKAVSILGDQAKRDDYLESCK